MKKLFCFVLTFCIFAVQVFAANKEVSVRIYLNKDSVVVGEMFKLSVETSGAQSFDYAEPLDFGANITQIRSEQSMSSSWVNGVSSVSYTIAYYLRATEKGDYTIGPFKVKIRRDIYETNSVEIKVSEAGSSPSVPSNQGGNNNSANNLQSGGNGSYKAVDRTNHNYLLRVNADKTEVYKNEPILITVDLYIRAHVQTISYEALKLPTTAWTENLNDSENLKGSENINGITYQHYEIEKKRVFISREGEYDIPGVVYNFHGLSPSSFFYSYEPMTLVSDPIKLKVKPLPPNAPANYSGLVGDFTMNISADKTTLDAKDIATLTVTLEGMGNLHASKDVEYKIDDTMDVFSSKNSLEESKSGRKVKKWEILFQPTETGTHTIVFNDLSYFDVKSGQYKVLPGKTVTLNVTENRRKSSEDDQSKVIHYNEDGTKRLNVVRDLSDITYIRMNIGKKQNSMNYDTWFNLFVIIYIVVIIAILLLLFVRFLIYRKNSGTPDDVVRAKNAYKVFAASVTKLQKTHKSGTTQETSDTIDSLYKILELYFVQKFNIDSVEFTSKSLQDKLSGKISQESLDKLRDYVLQFDMIRFGGADSSVNLADLISQISVLIREIEHQANEKTE